MSPLKQGEASGAVAGVSMHARCVDFQSVLMDQGVVADEIEGGLISEFDDEIEHCQSDFIVGPLGGGEDAMIDAVVLGRVNGAKCTEDDTLGSEDPSGDQLSERLCGRFGHHGSKDLRKWHERCCNVHRKRPPC